MISSKKFIILVVILIIVLLIADYTALKITLTNVK
jgi:hypothetical protein